MNRPFEEGFDWIEEGKLQDEVEPEDAEEDDLRARTLELLDFHLIRERVADHTTFFPARQLAIKLSPSYKAHEVEELQRETAEGRALLDEIGDVSLYTASDISTAILRAALGGVLTGMELLEIAEALEVQRRTRNGILRARNEAPALADMAEGIPDLQELRRQIRSPISTTHPVSC